MKTLKQLLQENLFPSYANYSKASKYQADRIMKKVLESNSKWLTQKRREMWVQGNEWVIEELLEELKK